MSSAENFMEISSISQKAGSFLKGLGLIVSIFRIPGREKSFTSFSLSPLRIKLWLIVYTVHLNFGMGLDSFIPCLSLCLCVDSVYLLIVNVKLVVYLIICCEIQKIWNLPKFMS